MMVINQWTIEIAQHIKSLAPKTLVMDGSLYVWVSGRRTTGRILHKLEDGNR
jgi:hypothetical protein